MGAGVLAMFVSSATNLAFPTLVGKVLDRTAGQKQVRIKACDRTNIGPGHPDTWRSGKLCLNFRWGVVALL